ncbi:MAG: hypothetical protein IE886_05945 [Campylobacterales bacterium]|nr:hypothetical protein [Campylobacterales bacterium]
MRDDFRLRDTLVAFYTQKRLEGKLAFMDALARDSRRDIRYAKDGPDMPICSRIIMLDFLIPRYGNNPKGVMRAYGK